MAYEWKFDDLDTYLNVTADDFDDDINMDIESLLSIFYASQPANSLQNGVVNPSLSIGPCSEPSSYSADEHFETHNDDVVGSFIFSPQDQSGASTSRTVCSGDSFESERKIVDFGFTKLDSSLDAVSSPSLCEMALPVLGSGCGILGFSNWDGDHDSSTTLNQPSHFFGTCRPDTQSLDNSCFQSNTSIKKEFIYMKEDIESKVTEINNTCSFTQKNDQQAMVSLLLGAPVTQVGFNSTRLKTNDEQLIYRAALQDLSQPKSEATPPDGALAVPLLRHQDEVIDLSLGLGSSSKPSSSHGSDGMFGKHYGDFVMPDRSPMPYSTSIYQSSIDSRGKMVNFGTYGDTLYNPHDRAPMPYSTSMYQSSCFSDTRFSEKESPKKTFIPSHTTIKNIKEETEGKLNGLNNTGSLPPKFSQPEAPSTVNLDDDDPDICILEDMSQPAHKKRCHVDEISGQWSTSSAPTSKVGFDHTRVEKKDEQSVYRAVLQDLSQPTSEATPPDGALTVPLMKHQRIALSWMVQKETKSMHCVGGILADDQGLGKTISTIALILKERSPPSFNVGATEVKKEMAETLSLYDVDQEDVSKHDKSNLKVKKSIKGTKSSLSAGTLIVCPTSVIRQWYDELHYKVNAKSKLSVLIYHGSNRTKDPVELAKYDVVLTTYAIVSMEVPIKLLPEEVYNQADDYNENFYQASCSSTRKRKLSKKDKKGAGKWGLDSSLRPLAKVRWFRVVLDEAQIIKNHRTKASRACWGLKAKRRWCLSGTPIQNSIDDLYSYFRFLRCDPYDEYATFRSTIKNPIEKAPARGYKKLQAVLTTMLLRRTKATFIDGKPIIVLPPKTVSMKKLDFRAEEREFYSTLEENSRAQFQEYRDAGTVQQNYASILVMLLRLRQACGHPLLVTGSRSSSELESSLEEAKQLSPEKRNSLLNCLEASLAICGMCGDPPEDAVVTTCEHVFCNQCILELLSSDDCECPLSGCKAPLDPSLVFSRQALELAEPLDHNTSNVSVKSEPLDHCTSNVSVKSETLDYYISNDGVNSSKIEAAKALKSSKITAAMEYLHSIVKPQEITMKTTSCSSVGGSVTGEKAIVFSQWTKMLDLFEACLRDSSIGFRRLDGTMSISERDKAVKDFNRLPQVSVMIMSLKAASLGLNMVAANHVLLLDLWWNPTTEEQAIDRAHRIGQTRPVEVLRFTVEKTIEDRIMELQKKKRQIVASAFGEDEAGRRQTRLTVDDLKYLFGF